MKAGREVPFCTYISRCRFPSAKAFVFPLRSAAIIFAVQLLLLLIFQITDANPIVQLLAFVFTFTFSVSYYVKFNASEFWNKVLEESLGLFPDFIMWCYYILIAVISVAPGIVGLFLIKTA